MERALFSGNDNVSANIDDNTIISENKNELIGIILNSKLSFEDHINNRKKASQKLNALAKVAPYMEAFVTFVTSQFGYCLLVSMFHGRDLNNKTNSLHERTFKNNI